VLVHSGKHANFYLFGLSAKIGNLVACFEQVPKGLSNFVKRAYRQPQTINCRAYELSGLFSTDAHPLSLRSKRPIVFQRAHGVDTGRIPQSIHDLLL
jgi:hypothetical protein